MEIKWAHMVELAEKMTADSGLHIGKKLTREHIVLTSYSRMNVRLAAQVSKYPLFNFHCISHINEGPKQICSRWI